MARQIANKDKTKKRGNPAWEKGGKSPNPSGRPRNEVSLVHWLRAWGEMSSQDAAQLCEAYARELKQVKGDLPMAAVAALRVWMAVMSEPTSGLFAQLLDRIDGPVATRIETNKPLFVIRLDKPTDADGDTNAQ